jgi:hypothetical protein
MVNEFRKDKLAPSGKYTIIDKNRLHIGETNKFGGSSLSLTMKLDESEEDFLFTPGLGEFLYQIYISDGKNMLAKFHINSSTGKDFNLSMLKSSYPFKDYHEEMLEKAFQIDQDDRIYLTEPLHSGVKGEFTFKFKDDTQPLVSIIKENKSGKLYSVFIHGRMAVTIDLRNQLTCNNKGIWKVTSCLENKSDYGSGASLIVVATFLFILSTILTFILWWKSSCD